VLPFIEMIKGNEEVETEEIVGDLSDADYSFLAVETDDVICSTLNMVLSPYEALPVDPVDKVFQCNPNSWFVVGFNALRVNLNWMVPYGFEIDVIHRPQLDYEIARMRHIFLRGYDVLSNDCVFNLIAAYGHVMAHIDKELEYLRSALTYRIASFLTGNIGVFKESVVNSIVLPFKYCDSAGCSPGCQLWDVDRSGLSPGDMCRSVGRYCLPSVRVYGGSRVEFEKERLMVLFGSPVEEKFGHDRQYMIAWVADFPQSCEISIFEGDYVQKPHWFVSPICAYNDAYDAFVTYCAISDFLYQEESQMVGSEFKVSLQVNGLVYSGRGDSRQFALTVAAYSWFTLMVESDILFECDCGCNHPNF